MDDDPTEEDVTTFIIQNRRFLSTEGEKIFRKMSKEDQKYVIKEGSLSNCRDPIAIMRSRAWNGCLQAHREWMESHRESSVDEFVDAFVSHTSYRWINEEAEELLRGLDFEVLWKVVDFGSMYGCRDPVAIIKRRIRDAKAGKSGKGSRGYATYGGDGREGRGGKGKSSGQGDENLGEQDKTKPGDKKRKWRDGNDNHEKALYEGRSLLCMNLPSLWTTSETKEFFNHQGEVEAVYLGQLYTKKTRTASIDFTTAEGAKNAALVCDRMEVKDGNHTSILGCSIRYKVEGTFGSKFVFPARQQRYSEVDPKIAQSEGRSIFLSKIPEKTTEEQIKQLVEDFGEVEAVYMLPSKGFTLACFISMVSPGEAAFAIRGLNNAQAFGSIISASYPIEKNLKRKKPHPEEESIPWYPVELRNFPHWTVCDDIKQTILSIGPGSQRVRIIHYDPEPSLSVARAYFKKEEDRDEIREKLSDFEISPGYILKACALPRTPGNGPGFSHTAQPSLPFGQPGLPSGPNLAQTLAAAQPLKLPDGSMISNTACDWNDWSSWNDADISSGASSWLPAAFVQQ